MRQVRGREDVRHTIWDVWAMDDVRSPGLLRSMAGRTHAQWSVVSPPHRQVKGRCYGGPGP